MTVTVEIVAPTGQTLTLDVYPIGSDTATLSGQSLTERTNSKGVYRSGALTLAAADYRVVAKSGTTPLIVSFVRILGTTDEVAYATDVLTESEIATAVWGATTRTLTESAGGGATAQEVWEYATRELTGAGLDAGEVAGAIRTELSPELAMIDTMNTRMEAQVPGNSPVVIVPAPEATQTAAYARCWNANGAPAEGVTVTIQLLKTESGSAGDAYSSTPATSLSDQDGLAVVLIPRDANLTFQARRGTTGKWIKFDGVDAETMELPDLLG